MSSATLKMGVENMVKHYFPEVKLIEGIDDPNSDVDPYY
jgi:Fe-S cluster biogenesis protein NfuA